MIRVRGQVLVQFGFANLCGCFATFAVFLFFYRKERGVHAKEREELKIMKSKLDQYQTSEVSSQRPMLFGRKALNRTSEPLTSDL